MRIHWSVALLGLDTGYCSRSCALRISWRHDRAHRNNFYLDAHDMCNSAFFDESPSGVGGWGDPTDDSQITTGGFKDVIGAYPSPHRIRRNCTVQPFGGPDPVSLFPDDPTAPPIPKDLMINTTMTKQNVDSLVDGFEGDFIGFQTYFESVAVSSALLSTLSAFLIHPYRAPILAPISSLAGERCCSGTFVPPVFVTDELS